MSNDNPPVTLPILDAFAWLHERGLTLAALWVKRVDGKPETHATVKPAPIPAPADPKPPKS